jgi:hypothetical protein
MSLSTVSTTSLGYQPGYQSNYPQNNSQNITEILLPKTEEPLSPEQKNTLQNSADAKLAEQVENIKSNYQSAKDLDLMQAYYQQQQKVLDIYIQTSNGSTSDSNNSSSTNNNFSAVNTLTDTYASLYAIHKNVKDGIQQLPVIPDNVTSPINDVDVLPASNTSMMNKQTDAYNSLMMPSTSSYLHLSA